MDHRLVEGHADNDHSISLQPKPNSFGSIRSRLNENVDPLYGLPQVAQHRSLRPNRLASAALLVLCMTGFAGWFAAEIIQHRSAQEVLADFAVDAAGQAQIPALTAPAILTDPAIWASGNPGMGRSGLDLSTSGFQLRSASIAPASDVLTTLLVYVNAEDRALALTIRPDAGTTHAGISEEVRADVTAFRWVDNGISYKLISDIPASILFMIAVEAHKQSCHRQTDARPHAFGEVFRGSVEKPAECQPTLKIVGKL